MKNGFREQFHFSTLVGPAFVIALAHFLLCTVLIGLALGGGLTSGRHLALEALIVLLSLGLFLAGPLGLALSSLMYGIGGALLYRVYIKPTARHTNAGHTLPHLCHHCNGDLRGHFDPTTGRTFCPQCSASYFGKPYEAPPGFCDHCGYDVSASYDPDAGRVHCPECGTRYLEKAGQA